MKGSVIIAAALVLAGQKAHANGIKKVSIAIEHPTMAREEPPWNGTVKPLRIEQTILWSHGAKDTSVLICWPSFSYLKDNVWSHAQYYDAHITPDGQAYVLTKRYVEFEGEDRYTEIAYFGLGKLGVDRPDYRIEDAEGNRVFRGSKGEQLVIVDNPSSFEETKDVKASYYELLTGRFIKSISIEPGVKFEDLGLVPAR